MPKSDKRVNISHLQFIVLIVFHFLGDTKQSSLAGLRRLMMAETNIYISRGAFWERLAGNRLKTIMESLVEHLMSKSIGAALLASDILRLLKETGKNSLNCRAIGFWNADEKRYHWYLTNLSITAIIIYSLYRLRWQIELIFKACKNSLNADAIPSADRNIIESLLLASLAAHLSSQSLYEIALDSLLPEESLAISFQRTASVFSTLKNNFILCILNPIQENINKLIQRIYLMIHELYDPNHRERETRKTKIYREIMHLYTG